MYVSMCVGGLRVCARVCVCICVSVWVSVLMCVCVCVYVIGWTDVGVCVCDVRVPSRNKIGSCVSHWSVKRGRVRFIIRSISICTACVCSPILK